MKEFINKLYCIFSIIISKYKLKIMLLTFVKKRTILALATKDALHKINIIDRRLKSIYITCDKTICVKCSYVNEQCPREAVLQNRRWKKLDRIKNSLSNQLNVIYELAINIDNIIIKLKRNIAYFSAIKSISNKTARELKYDISYNVNKIAKIESTAVGMLNDRSINVR